MSLGKHFINGVAEPVEKSLRHILRNDPSLRLIASEKVLYRQPLPQNDKVLLLSGGGAGHEPAHAGFLGAGMLDIVVSGNIFASPSASQVFAGLKAVNAPKGVLMIVKNYTGDKLNFGLAAEKARAEGYDVNMVLVQDDVSVQGSSLVGQRGLAGVSIVHKIAGALATQGADLAAVTQIAQKAADQMATAAVSLDRCSVPNRGKQESLSFDELEYGMGIHNEPGVRREKVQSLETVAREVISMLLKQKETGWTPSKASPVAVMVNNLGGLSPLEINIVAEEVLTQLASSGINVVRSTAGTFVSSLDAPGFSVTLLGVDDQLVELLDAPTSAPGWPKEMSRVTVESLKSQEIQAPPEDEITAPAQSIASVDRTTLLKIISAVAKTTTEDEPLITEYDTLAGDGDCGETLLNGINGLVAESQNFSGESIDIVYFFRKTAAVAERSMGGTSGAIYAIFLNAVASSLDRISKTQSGAQSPSELLSIALQQGLAQLYKYTAAREGHRTLMDALIPFVSKFAETKSIAEAYDAAKLGADKTKSMAAILGRASYVGQDRFTEQGGIPDPGALGVVSILKGIQAGLSG